VITDLQVAVAELALLVLVLQEATAVMAEMV
jgi:hypothetical protein